MSSRIGIENALCVLVLTISPCLIMGSTISAEVGAVGFGNKSLQDGGNMVYLTRRQFLGVSAASASSLALPRNAFAQNFDFDALKKALIEKLEVRQVADTALIRNIVTSSLANLHAMPLQIKFKAGMVSSNQNMKINIPKDTRALNLRVTNPNGDADDLITIRTSEIWPGGDVSGTKESIKEKTVTLSQSGNYKLAFDGEFGAFSLFIATLGWGCGLSISVNGGDNVGFIRSPDKVTGNGVPVHESFDFYLP
jgi:hypothetical protein